MRYFLSSQEYYIQEFLFYSLNNEFNESDCGIDWTILALSWKMDQDKGKICIGSFA